MRVLVVDDEPAVRDALSRALRVEGYTVVLADGGAAALERRRAAPTDLVILDVLMPPPDGLATCRALRAAGDDVPVLMLTAAGAVRDRVAGLDAGADDYLVKPFALAELLARVRALLRRPRSGPDGDTVLRFADLSLDLGTRQARRGGTEIRLTRTECAILEAFLRHPRQVLTRNALLERVWGGDLPATSNSLDVYLGYLRRKTETGGRPRLLHTVRGTGFVLRDGP